MQESMKAVSGPAISARLAEQMQESMKAVSGPAISARFAEQMQESMKALTGHLSPLPGASRANLRYVLGADASEILRNWAPQQAVAHAVELVSA
ncbi:MAG: hypothetical protein H0X58_02310, partial [Acidimicrobiia bacterium]|nr:hypothetical protein [Acidimicrobiia bacterium]